MVTNESETSVAVIDERAPPPARGSGKRKWLLVAGIAILIGLVVTGGLWLWQRSGEQPADDIPRATIVPSDERGQAIIEEQEGDALPKASPSPGIVSVLPDEAVLLLDQTSEQLAVTVEFSTSPSFSLSIGEIVKTFERVNIDDYSPAEDEPYSELRLIGGNGRVLSAHRFAVPTVIIVESEDLSEDPLQEIPSGDVYLVVPLNENELPVLVQIVGSGGQVFDEQEVAVSTLPIEGTEVPELVSSWINNLGRKVALSWRRLLGIRQTQAQSSCSPCFVIAVLGDSGEPITNTVQAVREMVDSLEPWAEYEQNIMVTPVNNTSDLGCGPVPVSGGREKPGCPNLSRIYRALRGMQWHAAVVVTQVDCPNCGSSSLGSKIIAVGRATNKPGLIGHELGHAIGRLLDEYIYRFGTVRRAYRPNCFLSESSCQAGLYNECRPGCNSVGQWRPATKLMHGPVSRPFGKLEGCIMEQAITRVLGQRATCDQGDDDDDGEAPEIPDETPPSPIPPGGNFWGGGI